MTRQVKKAADLLTRGQLDMLAQTLGTTAGDLDGLERLGAQDLRALRERISNVLFDAHAPTFARVSKLAPLVPNALAARVALKAIPPEVGGRAGGAIGLDHPDRAADLLGMLTPTYMADAAAYLDPRAIPVLAPRLPAAVLVPAANELLARRDYVTAARFVEHATDELIRGFERGITDDVGLLHTAALTPSTDRLNDVVRVLPRERQVRIVSSASDASDDVVIAALSVLARLDADLAERLGDEYLGGLDDAGLDRIVRVAIEHEAVAELLAVLSRVSDAHWQRLAASSVLADSTVAAQLAAGATTSSARRVVLAIAGMMSEPDGSNLAALVPSA